MLDVLLEPGALALKLDGLDCLNWWFQANSMKYPELIGASVGARH